MIYVLETPHQLAPRCWVASDRDDFVVRVVRTDWSGELDSHSTFEEAVEWCGHDLQYLDVYESTEEAARAVVKGNIGGHQPLKAEAELRKWVLLYAWDIEDQALLRDFLLACQPWEYIDLSDYLTTETEVS